MGRRRRRANAAGDALTGENAHGCHVGPCGAGRALPFVSGMKKKRRHRRVPPLFGYP
jgi:hypothetical protein